MILVEFWGGPGSGKSTLAAELYVAAKKRRVSVDLMLEHVPGRNGPTTKNWWGTYGWLYAGDMVRGHISKLQTHDLVISDQSLEALPFYAPLLGARSDEISRLQKHITEHYNILKQQGVKLIRFWPMERPEYDPRGRMGTSEETAKDMDSGLSEFLGGRVVTMVSPDSVWEMTSPWLGMSK